MEVVNCRKGSRKSSETDEVHFEGKGGVLQVEKREEHSLKNYANAIIGRGSPCILYFSIFTDLKQC